MFSILLIISHIHWNSDCRRVTSERDSFSLTHWTRLIRITDPFLRRSVKYAISDTSNLYVITIISGTLWIPWTFLKQYILWNERFCNRNLILFESSSSLRIIVIFTYQRRSFLFELRMRLLTPCLFNFEDSYGLRLWIWRKCIISSLTADLLSKTKTSVDTNDTMILWRLCNHKNN